MRVVFGITTKAVRETNGAKKLAAVENMVQSLASKRVGDVFYQRDGKVDRSYRFRGRLVAADYLVYRSVVKLTDAKVYTTIP